MNVGQKHTQLKWKVLNNIQKLAQNLIQILHIIAKTNN